MINNLQQLIYNCYLKNNRKGLPYKNRKNFEDLNEEIKSILIKLELFFKKFQHIKIEDFFEAPNIIYPSEKYPYIDFFTTRKAIKVYQLFLKEKELRPIEEQLEDIKKCLLYITKFCLDKKILLFDYSNFKEDNSYMPAWSTHYRQHKLNIYALIDLIDWNFFHSLTEEEKEIWFPGLKNSLNHFNMRYNNSCSTKITIKKIISKLNSLTKNKTKQN